MNSIDGYIDIFLENKTQTSKDIYRTVIKKFSAWLGKEVLSATKQNAWAYASYLKSQPGLKSKYCNSDRLSYASLKKYLNILYGFYNVLLEFKQIEENPFDSAALRKLGKVPQTKRRYDPIPVEKVKRVIKETESDRDRVIISVLFFGGLRVTEAINLRLEDLQKDKNRHDFLWLKDTKNGESVRHVLSDDCFKLLKKYVKQRKREGAKDSDFIFLNSRGNQLDRFRVREVFQRACKDAGLEGYTTQCTRVTSISKLLDDGRTPQDVQVFSRHKSIKMVMHYKRTTTSLKDHPALKLKY